MVKTKIIFLFLFIIFVVSQEEYFGVCGMDWFLNDKGICERCWDHNLCPGRRYSYECPLSFFRFVKDDVYDLYPKELTDAVYDGCLYGGWANIVNTVYIGSDMSIHQSFFENDDSKPLIYGMKVNYTMPIIKPKTNKKYMNKTN